MATIYVNEKRVCRTTFSDHFEFIKSTNHPVGPTNLITTDRAVINCLIMLTTIICFLMTIVMPELTPVWVSVGTLLYVAQLIEVFFCQTTKLIRHSESWDDLHVFLDWYRELKKYRPMITLAFTPTEE